MSRRASSERRVASACIVILVACCSPLVAHAQSSADWTAAVLGTQVDIIGQQVAPFHAAYSGANSLIATGDARVSHVYGLYAGANLFHGLQGYVDVEMARGAGIGHAVGLAGITNGDVIRQGSADLGSGPYVARAYLRYTFALGRSVDTLARAPEQMPGVVARDRIEIDAGKLAASDVFDLNRYANAPRQQFMNWVLFQNGAWDFAADTRGYTNGVAISWLHPAWAIRVGAFQMPTQANGNKFDPELDRANEEDAELTVVAPRTATIVRVLGFLNHARMGRYDVVNARAIETGSAPSIVADDAPGRRKYGFGLNLEQPLADSGETGAFARLGWNDGENESFAFTEVERFASGGLQLTGSRWRRSDDRLAIGLAVSGIADAHRRYLELGGRGFLVGDGALRYGPETIVEGYYRLQLGQYAQLSPDVQWITNPGYNRDRGPAIVTGLRVNLRY